MYKKTNANNKNRNPVIFKPKKMILNGIVYDVDSIETLNRIRSNIETKKKEDFELVEEQKIKDIMIQLLNLSLMAVIRKRILLLKIETNKCSYKIRQN